MTHELRIRGVEVLAAKHVRAPSDGSLDLGPLEAGNAIRTLTIPVFGDAPVRPEREDYVELKDGAGALVFAGKAQQPKAIDRPGERIHYEVTAQGWEAIFRGLPITVARTFPAGTPDAYMVKVLLDDNYGPISTTVQHKLLSRRADMPAMTFATGGSGKGTLGPAIDRIVSHSGSVWWINPDKSFRWNDVENEAPYVLVTRYGDDVVSAEITGPLEDFVDSTQRPSRVRVLGTGGVEFTATDWSQWALVQKRLKDEPGAPAQRVYELPDVLDDELTTTAQCEEAAFVLLAQHRERRTVQAPTLADGLRPGQLVAIHDDQLEPAADLDYHLEVQQVLWDHAYDPLEKCLGWLPIQRVSPTLIDAETIEYLIEAGDPEPFSLVEATDEEVVAT